jgi:hypothetical protein
MGSGEELDQLNYGNQWEEDPGPWALLISGPGEELDQLSLETW